MRRLENFVKIVILTLILIGVVLIADILFLTYTAMKTDSAMPDFSPAYIFGQLEKSIDENGEIRYALSQEGEQRIDSFQGFAFLLDNAGNVVWSYLLPDDVPQRYTVKEVVQFTRFYLNDYPVYVHIGDDEVLVVGLPKQTMWKYQISFRISTVDMFKTILPALFVANVAILLAGPFWIIKHDAHKREMQRTSWIAGVSHDIRTPLSLVIGYADELAQSAESGIKAQDVAAKAQQIENQAVRIKMLVTNLNTSNKLTYGMGVWHREKVLLPAVVRESICEVINRGLDEKYDISVSIPEMLEQLCVKGDRELIKRLIENLVNNAINHNREGCAVRISLMQQHFFVFRIHVLEVLDNGCGVGRKQLKSFRMSVRSDKLPEHGLGIRLVQQIAALHHWGVHFSNNKDGGFRCRVYLPSTRAQ